MKLFIDRSCTLFRYVCLFFHDQLLFGTMILLASSLKSKHENENDENWMNNSIRSSIKYRRTNNRATVVIYHFARWCLCVYIYIWMKSLKGKGVPRRVDQFSVTFGPSLFRQSHDNGAITADINVQPTKSLLPQTMLLHYPKPLSLSLSLFLPTYFTSNMVLESFVKGTNLTWHAPFGR